MRLVASLSAYGMRNKFANWRVAHEWQYATWWWVRLRLLKLLFHRFTNLHQFASRNWTVLGTLDTIWSPMDRKTTRDLRLGNWYGWTSMQRRSTGLGNVLMVLDLVMKLLSMQMPMQKWTIGIGTWIIVDATVTDRTWIMDCLSMHCDRLEWNLDLGIGLDR